MDLDARMAKLESDMSGLKRQVAEHAEMHAEFVEHKRRGNAGEDMAATPSERKETDANIAAQLAQKEAIDSGKRHSGIAGPRGPHRMQPAPQVSDRPKAKPEEMGAVHDAKPEDDDGDDGEASGKWQDAKVAAEKAAQADRDAKAASAGDHDDL